MLIRELNDPRLKLIYVTDVKVDKELAYADIFVSAVEGTARSVDVLAGFRVCQRVHPPYAVEARGVPRVPQLRFHWDPTPENADRIEKVLAELRNKRNTSS